MKKFNALISSIIIFFLFNCEDKVLNKELKVNEDKEIGYVSF